MGAHRAQRVDQRGPPLDRAGARPHRCRRWSRPAARTRACPGRTGRHRRRTTRTGRRGRPRSAGRTGRRRRGCSDGRTRPGGRAAGPTLYGSVMVRFMSHLMYEIGALDRTSDRTPKRWSTISGPRHVEDELLAALGPRPAGDADGPVRVRLEQPAPLADHLGLDPQAELDARAPRPCAGEPIEAVRAACAGRRTSRRATSRPRRAGRTSRHRGRTARRRGRAPTSRSRAASPRRSRSRSPPSC